MIFPKSRHIIGLRTSSDGGKTWSADDIEVFSIENRNGSQLTNCHIVVRAWGLSW